MLDAIEECAHIQTLNSFRVWARVFKQCRDTNTMSNIYESMLLPFLIELQDAYAFNRNIVTTFDVYINSSVATAVSTDKKKAGLLSDSY